MDGTKLVGGSPADRQRLLERMDEYLDANARFDWEKLQEIWSAAPEAVFFNLNGHTYKGQEHWMRLWRYYKDNVGPNGSATTHPVPPLRQGFCIALDDGVP